MRVFVSLQGAVRSLDTDVDTTVGDIKSIIRDRFRVNLKNRRNETDQFLSLLYQGSSLQDDWMYSDLGIPPGSTLVCCVGKEVRPVLTVYCVSFDEKIEYKEDFDVRETTVGTIRAMIQDSTGIHVSAFRLYSKLTGLELFDCHLLKVYGVSSGDTINMEIWPDVAGVVHAARENDITGTFRSLATFQDDAYLLRYELQVGLFIAAHYGYHQLATQLMKCGAKPDEPVGQHPSRDWCRASAHVDHVKTPAHEAAQNGRLKCLQHFLMFNYAILICKDARGLTPCNIARRCKQTECFKLLVAEQFRIPSVHSELSIHVYARVRKWCDRARMRVRLQKDKTAVHLLPNAEVSKKGAVVGQKVEINGFNGSWQTYKLVRSAESSSFNANHIDKITAEPKCRSIKSRGNLQYVNAISRKSHSISNPMSNSTEITRSERNTSGQGAVAVIPNTANGANTPSVSDSLSNEKVETMRYGLSQRCQGTITMNSKLATNSANLHRNTSRKDILQSHSLSISQQPLSLENVKTPLSGSNTSRQRAITAAPSCLNTSNGEHLPNSNVGRRTEKSAKTRPFSYSLSHETVQSSIRVNSLSRKNTVPNDGKVESKRLTNRSSFRHFSRDKRTKSELLGKMTSHRELTLAKRKSSRYIWKSLDDNPEHLSIPLDKRCPTRTPAINVHDDLLESNCSLVGSDGTSPKSSGKMKESDAEGNGSIEENFVPSETRPVRSRNRLGESRLNTTSGGYGRTSFASIAREVCCQRKAAEHLKFGFNFDAQANSPVKQRSVQGRELVHLSRVESNADACLRVACETFRKKSWLGQFKMALVVNTNICKRR